MASKKDLRRPDLVIPYVEPSNKEKESDMSSKYPACPAQHYVLTSWSPGTFAGTMPMAAMFTRNKMIGWTALIFALQNWLAETPEQKRTNTTPGYISVGMSVMAVMVTYLPLFLPPQPGMKVGSGTEAPAPAPPS